MKGNRLVTPLCWLAVLLTALVGTQSFACSCRHRIDPDYWPVHSESIIVAIPNRAEVVERPGVGQDRVLATMVLLDVLKGPRPRILPVMTAPTEPQSTACETSIDLGSAYVLFLEQKNTSRVHVSSCMPHGRFTALRARHEQFCMEGHPQQHRCSLILLELLRNADEANEKYGLDSRWLAEHQDWVRRDLQRRAQRREERTRN